MREIVLLMPPSHKELIFDGLMSSRISEIKSLGSHTYNRLRVRLELDTVSLNEKFRHPWRQRKLDGGHG